MRLDHRVRPSVAEDPQGATDWGQAIVAVGGGEAVSYRFEAGTLLAWGV